VVTAREDAPGDKRLVAYVVINPNPNTAVKSSELTRFLQQKLPDYMIPSAFVFLKRIPLAAGGKVDRRALPAPHKSQFEHEGNYVAPRTPVEELLAKIWINVLGVERIGIHDNFFEMGGHSLLAMRIMARVNREFGKKVPVRMVFDAPTIARFAARLQCIPSGQKDVAPHRRGFNRLATPESKPRPEDS
jgi:acyl carrier protein